MATTNTLGVYNPIFYAQEALIQLEKALGMASRIHMGFDQERKAFGKGDVINIRRPSTFTAADAPATAVDLTTETVSLTLNKWKEVKFSLTDKELALTGERIIQDHIRPAAYALADNIDTALRDLYYLFPYFGDATASALAVSDLTTVRKNLFDQKVPLGDVGNLHLMVGGQEEMELLNLAAFSQQQGAGDLGVQAQLRGTLGTKFGMEVFANQNVKATVAGDVTTMADVAGLTTAIHAKLSTSIAVDGLTTAGVIKKGDSITIDSSGNKYAITADVTMSSGAGTVVIAAPGLQEALTDNQAITINKQIVATQSLAFHRNSMAIAMAPLSEMGSELGAQVATIQDPVTGLSLRSRIYYVGNSSEVHVALDVLYGVQCLDGRLGYRMQS